MSGITENLSTDERYPIGRLIAPDEITPEYRTQLIDQIDAAPSQLRAAVDGLSDEQLDTPYRDGGWTVRQVVHHLPDSHLNGYTRVKLALAEDRPVIKTYDQEDWLALSRPGLPIEPSLTMFDGLQKLWAELLRSLSDEQWKRGFVHPELRDSPAGDEPWRQFFSHDGSGHITVEGILPTYAWHGRHHIAHITSLRQRKDW